MSDSDEFYPCSFVIFGATGHLSATKLLPALYDLEAAGRLPEVTNFIAFGRREHDDASWARQMEDWLRGRLAARYDATLFRKFAARFSYVRGDLRDPEAYQRLLAELGKPKTGVCSNIVFYLAIKPSEFGAVVANLAQTGLNRPRGLHRIVIEKPFGEDLESAKNLNQLLHTHFDESQIFRIDHYLGKETVQNLLVFRFGNGMFEPVWNRRYIDHVQITAAETVGIEHRASYCEGAGALRDMVQNHLMQVLALVAMEPPIAFTADSVRDRKMDALLAVQPLVTDETQQTATIVRAQYRQGWVNGSEVPGYREEPGVGQGSTTETFVAARVHLDNWRWAGVPFYLRTGKRLPKRTTEIAIQFRRPPLEIFRRASQTPVAPDLLIVNVQPDEGISLRFEAKLPGTRMQIAPVMMNFRYGTTFGGDVPEAYETLLLDATLGDTTLFARHDFVEASWALITPVLEAWRDRHRAAIATYEAGEWGPTEADRLIESDGRAWRTL